MDGIPSRQSTLGAIAPAKSYATPSLPVNVAYPPTAPYRSAGNADLPIGFFSAYSASPRLALAPRLPRLLLNSSPISHSFEAKCAQPKSPHSYSFSPSRLFCSPNNHPRKKKNSLIPNRSKNSSPLQKKFSTPSTSPEPASRSSPMAKSSGAAASAKPTSHEIVTSRVKRNFASAPSAKLLSLSRCSNSKKQTASICNLACKTSR